MNTGKIESGNSYIAPQMKVITLNPRNVLCVSPGNESMPERDYGNGGFA